jgi:CRP/FNR family transcriptional regulator
MSPRTPRASAIPAIPAVPFLPGASTPVTALEREQLLSIATECRVPRHATVFERGEPADAIYSIIEGVARSWRPMPSGDRHILAFLLQRDLVGLARLGRYVNTVEAITPLKLFRFPTESLSSLLRGNPELQFKVLCRVTQKLRESQRRGAITARRDLHGRIAMLLAMMEESQSVAPKPPARVSVPLSAPDIGEFVGASGPAVSKVFRDLERHGILQREGRHMIRIVDRSRFESLAEG